MDNKISEIKKFIQENMGHEYEAHNFQHAFRVFNNATRIMELEDDENLNKLVILTSCLVMILLIANSLRTSKNNMINYVVY